MTMRGLGISALVFLAFAGVAVASDYMLPVLLDPGEPGSVTPGPQQPPQQPQGGIATPAPGNPVVMGIAMAGAFLIVVGTFIAFGRAGRKA